MAATYNPKDGLYYDAESAEDAHYVRMGRPDLVPGIRTVAAPRPAAPSTPTVLRGTPAPDGTRWEADSAEDAFFISLGRSDLVPGARRC